MATWQAFITVPQDAMVIMSGDKFLRITDIEDTAGEHYDFIMIRCLLLGNR